MQLDLGQIDAAIASIWVVLRSSSVDLWVRALALEWMAALAPHPDHRPELRKLVRFVLSTAPELPLPVSGDDVDAIRAEMTDRAAASRRVAELLSSASDTQEWEGVRLLHELPWAPELIPVLRRQTWSSARNVSEAWELALLERVPAFLERHAFDGAVDAVAEMLCADPGEPSGRDTWVRTCDRVRWLMPEHAERLDARRSEVFGAGVDAWLSELEPAFGEQIAERTWEPPDRLARARSLLEGGLDPDAVLHATVSRGSAPLFRLLLDAGADPGARDAKGRSSLDLALGAGGVKGRVGHAAIAGILLDRGQVPADGLKPGKWAKARLASAAPSYGDDQTGLGWMLTREPAPEHRAELLTRCLKQVLDRKSLSQELLEAWASLYPESLAQALLHHLEREPAAFRAIAYAEAALLGDRWRRRLGDGHLAPRLGDALSAHFERLLELAGPSPDDNAQMLLHVAARSPEQEQRAWERSEAAAADQKLPSHRLRYASPTGPLAVPVILRLADRFGLESLAKPLSGVPYRSLLGSSEGPSDAVWRAFREVEDREVGDRRRFLSRVVRAWG